MAALVIRQNNARPKSSLPSDLTKILIQHKPDKPEAGGGFCLVYKCTLKRKDRPAVDVAVKVVLKLPSIDSEALRREIGIWRRLRHRCIVSLLGTTTHYSPMSIVSSWMPHGTLNSYLKKDNVQKSLAKKYKLLSNVANGLNYLHSKNVVHGDLSSDNVLINKKGQACLSDFGLSSMMKPGERYQYLRVDEKRPGAWRWAAPELIEIEDEEVYVPSPSSDIYSYGCIIYEVLSGSIPSLSLKEVLNGKTPERLEGEHMHDEDWIFVLQCWLSLPSLRPSSSQALSLARARLSMVSQGGVKSHGTLESTYSVHLGANLCKVSSSVLPPLRPAFSDPAIIWKSIDRLAEALITLFTSKQYQDGLDDAIVLYHVSLSTLMMPCPTGICLTSSLDKISSAIAGNITHPHQHIISRVAEWYRSSFGNNTSDILCRLQLALACAENAKQTDFSLEAYEKSLQLVQSHVLETRISAWAESVERLSTGIAVDAAAAALRIGDSEVGKAVELLEWGKELLRMCIVQSHVSEENRKQIQETSSGCLRPSFSDLRKATQGGPVVMLIASRQSCDAIIVSSARHQAIHVPLKTISLDSLTELSTTFQSCISSAPGNSETVEKGLKDILQRLWVDIIGPVMNYLGPEDVPPESRIWWCLTSAFSTLPIHAAGVYDPKGRRLSRHYVSSYTSSINSLLQTQRTCTDHPKAGFASIYVSKPPQNDEKKEFECPAIRSPGLEPDLVMSNLPASLRFRRYREVTQRDALKAFKDHGWFHLMAYASRTAAEPLNPYFLMCDGSLSIFDIIGASVGPKEFAFLSPRPIRPRSSWMQDEVIQFAAGLQISGFKSVVGMMSNLGDFKVIDKFYRALFRSAPPNCTRAAQALHDTLEDMANSDAGLSLIQRVAFAHFGL